MPKFFMMMCSTVVVNETTAAEYHPETNDRAERFNSILISWPRHYMF